MLDILAKGLLGLHFFVNDLEYPIVVATYSKEDEKYVIHLEKNIRKNKFSNKIICLQCQKYHIYYKVLGKM